MVKIMTHPATGKAIIKTLTGLAKVGAFATAAILAQKTFSAAGSEFIAEAMQSYRQVKDIA